jgi:hypothetical protein
MRVGEYYRKEITQITELKRREQENVPRHAKTKQIVNAWDKCNEKNNLIVVVVVIIIFLIRSAHPAGPLSLPERI